MSNKYLNIHVHILYYVFMKYILNKTLFAMFKMIIQLIRLYHDYLIITGKP